MGYLLMKSHLPFYRALMQLGVLLFIYCDWEGRDYEVLKRGQERLLAERTVGSVHTAVQRLDAWTLRHLVFFFTNSVYKVLGSMLPDKIPLIEQRIPRIRKMLDEVPAG